MRGAVVLESVTFSYPDATSEALRGVSVEVPEGCFCLVVGATGSGKSTLLRTMNGLVPHFTGGRFEGRARIAGRDTLEHKPRELADVAGFVPQDPRSAFVVDRVEDELAYALENLRAPRSLMRRRVEEALDLLDLSELRDLSVQEISGGERQRVAIAAALTVGPRVLLLDEPTSQLDPQGAEDVLAALQRLVHDLGLTVIAAEHRLERIAGFADLALGCSSGEVVSGAPAEVLERLEIGPPVTRLGRLLGWHPPPLTVRDARRRVRFGPRPGQPRPPAQGQVRIEARALRASYGSVPVLGPVELALRGGETAALMGRNGAGKTTLLRCLAGLKEPTAGTVRAGGRAPRPGHDVALCPQVPEDVLFRDRVELEVETTLRAFEARTEAREVLAWLGIGALAGRHPRDLSAGERLLVAIAAVVAGGAPVLLLDEPTRGLDAGAKNLLIGLLRRYTTQRKAVLLATHDVELVAAVAERVVMLASGEVIADGPPAEILGDSAVFAPQMTRLLGPGWLTVDQVAGALAR